MQEIARANQALFDGNRGEIAEILVDSPRDARVLWLLASAADGEEERMALLARVHATQEQPYADMAREILERERYFAQEIARVPQWQAFLRRRGHALIRLAIAVPFVVLMVWIGSLFIFPATPEPVLPTSEPQNVPSSAIDTAADPTITPMPTLLPTPDFTPLPFSQSANYMPLGALRLLNVVFPAQWVADANNRIPELPPGSVYLALRYEFTCGTAQAFCEQPPQAQLALELTDPALETIPDSGIELWGEPSDSRIASGAAVEKWVVFAVPQNQSPRRLLIGIDSDRNNEVDTTLSLDLPR